jgi:recombination protein RecT
VHALDWQSEKPVPLLKNVMRLTAPNPSVMTGPGTNTYIVGDAATGYIVIDPGPNDAGAPAALLARHGRRHPHDRLHALACRPLARAPRRCRRCARARPPILGLPSAPTARPASAFTPDRELADGEACCRAGADGRPHTLRVIHTPGHAANHLCLVLEEDGLLFSGDHILNGSTTVVDPPDGDMTPTSTRSTR